MKRVTLCIIFFLIILPGSSKTGAQNKTESVKSNLDSLTFIGHASVKIKTAGGKVIYIDPFAPGDYSDSADVILVTHSHQDHNNVSLVTQKENCMVITYEESNLNGEHQSFTIDDLVIYAVTAYNENHDINNCVGYVIEFSDIKLYHAGDTGNIPEMEELADSNITYALLPVDSIFTMSPAEATDAANEIRADFNIPIHTEPPPDNYNEDKVSRFTPDNKLIVRNGETIALNHFTTDLNDQKVNRSYQLYQNYPNPFNPATNIRYSIGSKQIVVLKVFDLAGNEIATLVNEEKSAGEHSIIFNTNELASGIYFYRLQAGNFNDTKKLLLVK